MFASIRKPFRESRERVTLQHRAHVCVCSATPQYRLPHYEAYAKGGYTTAPRHHLGVFVVRATRPVTDKSRAGTVSGATISHAAHTVQPLLGCILLPFGGVRSAVVLQHILVRLDQVCHACESTKAWHSCTTTYPEHCGLQSPVTHAHTGPTHCSSKASTALSRQRPRC